MNRLSAPSVPRLLCLFLVALAGMIAPGAVWGEEPPAAATPATAPATSPTPFRVTRLEGKVWQILDGGRLEPLATGSLLPPGSGLRTGEDGQVRLEGTDGLQVRMKEDGGAWYFGEPQGWRVERGCLGWMKPPAAVRRLIRVATPHVGIELPDGIIVVKVVPLLTRTAVLRGEAALTHRGGWRLSLASREEAAAAFSELSSSYQATDDLYFAWYWQKQD